MELDAAKAAGAVAMFGEKYESRVRVVNVSGVSMELCGGTHVTNTAEIGGFKITAEAGIASGIRRVEAVAGPALIPHLNSVAAVASALASRLKVGTDGIVERVDGLMQEVVAQEKSITALKAELAVAKAASLASKVCPPTPACRASWIQVVLVLCPACQVLRMECAARGHLGLLTAAIFAGAGCQRQQVCRGTAGRRRPWSVTESDIEHQRSAWGPICGCAGIYSRAGQGFNCDGIFGRSCQGAQDERWQVCGWPGKAVWRWWRRKASTRASGREECGQASRGTGGG
jgi:hypothetical protein